MKRSEIDAILEESVRFFDSMSFRLPAFAAWSPATWQAQRRDCSSILEQKLGWDVTDFGTGDFAGHGLVLFTLRNGPIRNGPAPGALYAEKIMMVRPMQRTPMHFHWSKTEDLVNRGGGRLAIRVFQSSSDEGLSDAEVPLVLDGVTRTVEAGETLVLEPGSSMTAPPQLYHSFWALDEAVLLGEVSTTNDDVRDNRFLERSSRFPVILEDAPARHLLVSDYPRLESA